MKWENFNWDLILGIDANTRQIVSGHVWELIGIALSTFVGASAAFYWNIRYEKRKDIFEQYRAGIRAQFALIRQYELLYSVRKHSLDDSGMRENPNRHLELRPYSITLDELPTILPAQLSFMLDIHDAELLHRMDVIENKFVTTVGTLKDRNLYHTEFQHEFAQLSMITVPRYAILKDMTDQLYDLTDGTLDDLLDVFPKFREALRRRFSKRLKEHPLNFIPPKE